MNKKKEELVKAVEDLSEIMAKKEESGFINESLLCLVPNNSLVKSGSLKNNFIAENTISEKPELAQNNLLGKSNFYSELNCQNRVVTRRRTSPNQCALQTRKVEIRRTKHLEFLKNQISNLVKRENPVVVQQPLRVYAKEVVPSRRDMSRKFQRIFKCINPPTQRKVTRKRVTFNL